MEPFQVNANIISRNPCQSAPACTITFLESDTVSPWGKELESTFLQRGYTTTRATLGTLPVDAECIVSLLDLNNAFLHDMDEKSFCKIKDLFALSDRIPIVWITPSVQTRCRDPRFSLVLGLSRTLRRESVGNIITIEIDTFHPRAQKAVLDIYQKTQRTLAQGALRDTEYVVRNEKIFVSRFHWRSLGKRMEHIPCPTTPKCLSVGRHGLLDTLHWKAIVDSDLTLADGQIEVDIHYVGLNFKVNKMTSKIYAYGPSSGSLFSDEEENRISWLLWG